jgi:hypothetical protein
MKFIVFYTEGCSPRVKSFTSLEKAKLFSSKFLEKHKENTLDNWIDVIIEGRIVSTYEGWYGPKK